MASLPDGWVIIPHSDAKGTQVEFEKREIVFCKHCYAFDEDVRLCYHFGGYTKPDSFCSDGERKDDSNA